MEFIEDFITHEELNKSLGKRNLSQENLEKAFVHILDENITLVEKSPITKSSRKKITRQKKKENQLKKVMTQ